VRACGFGFDGTPKNLKSAASHRIVRRPAGQWGLPVKKGLCGGGGGGGDVSLFA